jgi:tRNA threonylcarbamoyladenosine biosynthesis protein TsaB
VAPVLTLAIDTATPHGGVALVRDGAVLGERRIEAAREHSRLIPVAIRELLAAAGVSVGAVDVVAVSRGPGSFTGIRVGLAFAKAFCASGTPRLVLVSSLAGLARGAHAGEDVAFVAALFNARRGQVYAGFYPVADGVVSGEAEEFACDPIKCARRWPGLCLVAGDGAEAYREGFASIVSAELWIDATPERLHPRPGALGVLGEQLALAGTFTDPATAAPSYLREAAVSTPKSRPGSLA